MDRDQSWRWMRHGGPLCVSLWTRSCFKTTQVRMKADSPAMGPRLGKAGVDSRERWGCRL